MEMANKNKLAPDKRLAAVCGLFCPACHVFIATQEDTAKLTMLSQRYQRPIGQLQCNGCRSEKRCFFCETMCFMAKCAAEKGIDFCGECADYPCSGLKEFQSLAPHRIELWESHARRKEVGLEQWFAEIIEHYSCPRCHTINSAYDLKCRKCGNEPSNAYVRLHGEAIKKHLAKAK